jgi:hypothetical protein
MITIEIGPGIIIGSGIGIHITPVVIEADLTTENDESLLTESGDNLVVEL